MAALWCGRHGPPASFPEGGLAGAGCLGVPGAPCGVDGAWRQVIGFSLLWDTALGPLRFNFTNAIAKEDYDQDQSFDLTIQAKF